mgnify:FL=1
MKNKSAFILLFLANSISGVAQGICMIAIPWYLTSTLNMPTLFGTIYASLTFMALFWGLLVGTLIDKYNRKKIFLSICAVGGVVLLSTALLGFYNDGLHYGYAALVFGLTYFIYSVHYPALYAFAQEISEPKNYRRITTYIEIQGQFTNMLGGACAALLLTGISSGPKEVMGYLFELPFSIEKWDLHQIFLLDGITYVIAFLLISFMKYESIADLERDTGTILERIKLGFSYLTNNKVVFIFGIVSFTVFVTVLIVGFYLTPIYVTKHLHGGGGVYATADMFFAFGAILAGAGIHWVFHRLTSVQTILFLSTMTAGIYFFFMYNTNIPVFYAAMLLLGMSNAGIRITRVTYLFKRIPNAMIGRVTSIFGMTNVFLRVSFISLFTIPFFVEGNNIIYPFLILGVFILIFNVPLIIYHKAIEKDKN